MPNVTLTYCVAVDQHLPTRPSYKNNIQNTNMETDIFLVFQTIFNYEVQWVLPESGTWGMHNKTTGQWDGCVRELETDRADVAALTITQERSLVSVLKRCFCKLG